MNIPKHAQQIALPLMSMQVLAGYGSDVYRAYYGRDNYGVDATDRSDPCVYAGGSGVVLCTGHDESLGGTVIVRYDHVYNHRSEQVVDLVVRYNHLSAITTAAGRPVAWGELLGLMGSSPWGDRGVLLHIEVDTDLCHPTETPSLLSVSTFLRPGDRNHPSVIDPCDIFCRAPGQSIELLQPDWCAENDFDLPQIESHTPGGSLSVFEKFESALRATESYLEEERRKEAGTSIF